MEKTCFLNIFEDDLKLENTEIQGKLNNFIDLHLNIKKEHKVVTGVYLIIVHCVECFTSIKTRPIEYFC